MPNKSLRILFAGTPEFAAVHLSALLDSQHQIIGVYTQPDRPAGRGKKLQASPVKQVALDAGITVFQPVSLKSEEEQQKLAALNADVMVVVAYGLLLPQPVLDAPTHGCLNVHGSILPRWRGAAPIQRAIEAGDTETGITIMQMDAGLDTGDMLLKAFCNISATDTAGSLHDKLADLGPPALMQTLEQICTDSLRPEKQDNALATYANKLTKEEGLIDWQLSSHELLRKIRAFNPFPVCHSTLDGERVRVFSAVGSDAVQDEDKQSQPVGTIISHANKRIHVATDDGAIALTQLQLPGKKAMASADLLNGMADKLAIGTRLGQ